MHHNTRRLNRVVPKASSLQKDQSWGYCSENFLKICSARILSVIQVTFIQASSGPSCSDTEAAWLEFRNQEE